jgi:hypothetical protein
MSKFIALTPRALSPQYVRKGEVIRVFPFPLFDCFLTRTQSE